MCKGNRYSVYDSRTDQPIAIWRSAQDCAKAMGVELQTFYSYLKRMNAGTPVKKYEIIKHDTTDEEDWIE
jgi:hypothetical protein